ncbi:hypothetical protein MalM25_14820 [Planctomycetes bacterium MalM25]|nr:hypothetical protein MalM25_14820 [Planctomycetes bacterium MalM25]
MDSNFRVTQGIALTLGTGLLVGSLGCDSSPPLAPVQGVVTYNGEPLEFGYVMFQPPKGQPAQGQIAADGTFTLATEGHGPGAFLGQHRVSVYCYEGHRPGAVDPNNPNQSLGASLIPPGYSRGGMSGLSAEVTTEGLSDFAIELSSRGPGR